VNDWSIRILLVLLLVAVSVNAYFSYSTNKAVGQVVEASERPEKWEYTCVESDRQIALKEVGVEKYLDQRFTKLGNRGWRMVGYAMNNGTNVRYVCFSRPEV